ncbi:hypothetical protein MUB52_01385 [Roseobacter sp. WL0113]|uniref:Uncharacterized protein n=1 Tax=Roseobacter sinensis TaxID=2931391 RepID=A0ABT3B9G8_9RHOB|nr:hypothetical protein [Roseobacter sp. WL0113]MCV3270069.1 hypothetical protein [Roseobacter sp. WL0113]
MTDIEVIGGFIWGQKPRLLREGAGDHHALAFAARQYAKMPISETRTSQEG